MIMKTSKIPDTLKTLKEKLGYLEEKGRKVLANMQKTNTHRAIGVGKVLLTAKKLCRKEGKTGYWKKFRRELFPDRSDRTPQRYMRLAQHVDLEKTPALAYLPQDAIHHLIELANGTPVDKYLSAKNIEVDIKHETEEISTFKEEVANLVRRERKSDREVTPKKTTMSDKFGRTLNTVLKQIKQIKASDKPSVIILDHRELIGEAGRALLHLISKPKPDVQMSITRSRRKRASRETRRRSNP
jgi:hypothetical protein